MLYDRWLEIAQARAGQLALADVAGGRRWTFRQLARAGDRPLAGGGDVEFPAASGPEFIISVLRCWRSGAVLCPLEPGQEAPEVSRRPPRGIVHLKLTSATTGPPRVVAFRAGQLAADCDNIVGTMGLRPDWPNLGVISLAHSYGFSNLVLPLLLAGIPLILVGTSLPEPLLRTARAFGPLTLAGVPALWRAWYEASAIPPEVKLAISAGAPLPASVEHAVHRASGLKIHTFYGSSETGGIAFDDSAVPRDDGACVGAPMKQTSVRISNDGTVVVRGKAVGETYWPAPDPRLRHGVFRTADLGEFRNGLLYLQGRAGDLINVAGRKVAPESIERALAAHPDVRECLVFGVPAADSDRGEMVVACVSAEKHLTPHALARFLSSRLPGWQLPRGWWIMDDLPATARGKRSRSEWRERYLQRGRS